MDKMTIAINELKKALKNDKAIERYEKYLTIKNTEKSDNIKALQIKHDYLNSFRMNTKEY